MRKLLLPFFLFTATVLAAQSTPPWTWAVSAHTTGNEIGNDVAVDSINGAIAVVGTHSSDISYIYGSQFVGSTGGGFVAKYNSLGAVVWAFKLGNGTTDVCSGVTLDNAGNIYVTGYITGNADFKGNQVAPSTILASVGGRDVFVAKYDPNGILIWARLGGGAGNDEGLEVAVNSNNEVFVTGTYTTTALFGALNTNATFTGINGFVVSYSSVGTPVWLAKMSSNNNDFNRDIIADNAGVVIIGDFVGPTLNVYDGTGALSTSIANVASGMEEIHLISFSNTGAFTWGYRVSSAARDLGRGIALGGDKIYITGSVEANTNFPLYLSNPVLKTGTNKDMFVACIDKASGWTIWAFIQPGTANQEGISVDALPTTGEVFITGYFITNIQFPSWPLLLSTGNEDTYVAKYTPSGGFLWAKQAGTLGRDMPSAISAHITGEVYVTGDYANVAQFTPWVLPDDNGSNVYVAKIACPAILNNTASANQTICENAVPATLIGSLPTGGNPPLTYLWEEAPDIFSWVPASGTNNAQNYSPPALSTSTYYRRWVISSAACGAIPSDTILITVDPAPSASNAGPDQNLCNVFSTSLAGNTPIVGTGVWTLVAGSGTITTPSSPTSGITGLGVGTNTFQWSITNGVCPAATDQVSIIVSALPSASNAGPDQILCNVTTSTFAGNTPGVGSGLWTLIAGSGTITSPSSPTSGVTGLSVGTNTFQWTISNGSCPPTSDQMSIIISAPPTTSNAGPDQNLCNVSISTFAGNIPGVGTGVWTLIAGSGTITTPSSATSGVTALSVGTNTFQWTISNGSCPNSTDQISIIVSALPSAANAGPDQNLCNVFISTFAGNTPVTGTGLWTLIAGSGTITTPGSPTSGVTGLSVGTNTFQWTISNGACTPTTDQVSIIISALPSVSNAGPDQNLCNVTSSAFAANTPGVGTGVWTLIAGSGTITTPSSPTSAVTALSVGTNTFQWTISNGSCPPSTDQVSIIISALPTSANAGPDQNLCNVTTSTFAGNTPVTGTGLWTLIAGSGTITTPSSPTSGVTGLSVGTNTFQWSITNGSCPSSTDQMSIIISALPTVANAGPDQNLCNVAISTFAGNTPVTGTGLWTLIAGSGTITTPSSPTSGVTGLAIGTNTFQWTISNGSCPSSTDQMSIIISALPTVANAGPDQNLCNVTTSTFAGNTPVTGTGLWTLIAGSGTITTPTSSTSGVTGLSVGTNTFQWTITNGSCPSSTDQMSIIISALPTVSNAGPDQNLCNVTISTFAGNTPVTGTGLWTLIVGSGTITTPSSPTSGVTGLAVGTNTFQWTISNGSCPSSTDQMSIIISALPTVANAGPDQNLCNVSTSTFAGNIPVTGTGLWTLIAGSGTITTPSSASSGVTGLSVGTNTFQWTISNGSCPSSSDQMSIIISALPTVANAGPDQNLCNVSISTFAGNTPVSGTGLWTLIAGSGTIISPTSPTSSVTGLSVGTNTFQWTISNGSCPPSTDLVNIVVSALPTAANAGPDQNLCNVTTSTFAGNTPVTGTGLWTLIAGSGTITTPSSPTSGVTGLSVGTNTFQWTISNGTCPPSTDQMSIIISGLPTTANAGPDQNLCNIFSTSLAGNTPLAGTGVWTLVAGSGTITTPSSPTSGVTGLSLGTNTFQWTISNGSCPPSTDLVNIVVYALPTIANAGPDQNLCNVAISTFAGNTPVIGTGLWSLIAGSGTITSPSSPTSGVTGLSVGTNTFQWTISNGSCPPSTDQMSIIISALPTAANAGPDQNLCIVTTSTFAGNTPVTGTGLWTLIAGTGTITTPSSPTSGVTGLSVGTNTFQWTISNGSCPPSSDQMSILISALPTVANAGPDQNLCNVTTSSFAGNTPVTGTGLWTLIAGSGTITSPSSPTSGVTGLSVGTNTFQWTISNGSCPPSTDQMSIIISALPTVANAGADQNLCNLFTSTFAGNNPVTGTGLWTLIAGTGTITTPSSPTSGVTGLSLGTNTFQWTISNGSCPPSTDQVSIIVSALPSLSNAGPDQNLCNVTTSAFAGNTPVTGTGLWTLIAGSGTITSPSSPTSGVTGLSVGTNTFQWTISNGSCPPSTDQMSVIISALPTVANAGADQNLCNLFTSTFAGNNPVTGTGLWTLIAGSGTITTPSSPTSGVTGLSVGTNTFQWTISNGSCPPSIDQMSIIISAPTTVSNAGPDQNLCNVTSSTFAGNTPVNGTGMWTLVAGSGTITTPSSPSSTVTGLSVGINTFMWTISNAPCASSSDLVDIIVSALPTVANAGPDQNLCNVTTSSFAGNTPVVGTGLWTLIAGTGIITTPSSPTSGVTGLSVGTNTFQWTITSGSCPASSDQMSIIISALPTLSNAGPDQNLCNVTNSTFAGNTPLVGSGLWTLVAGSGTITTPSSPGSTVTGLSFGTNTFMWAITNGSCPSSSDLVDIIVSPLPSISNAGPDQNLCNVTSSSFAGNTPVTGTGLWTLVAGSGVVTTPSSPTSSVVGLGVGTNTFEWTISSGSCPPSVDQMSIIISALPTVANAGPDQNLCNVTTSAFAGNTPVSGSGLWTLIAGSGTITTPSSPTSSVTGLAVGTNTFEWTVTNGSCPPSTDQMSIIISALPTVADAGPDQVFCNLSSSVFAGNTPLVGTGLWTLLAGTGTITTPNSPTSTVTGLSIGLNTFQWTISNGSCPASFDLVNILIDPLPTVSNAGPDQNLCNVVSSSFAANTPSVGTGLWNLIAGSGIITTPSSEVSAVTGLTPGINIFTWTISSGTCPPSIDTVRIIVNALPTVAFAGPDQNLCNVTSSTFAGNLPIIGSGLWTLFAGSGVITVPASEISGVTGLTIGTNTFVWTITNGVCPLSSDTVNIIVSPLPTSANAGPDQGLCNLTNSLFAANTAIIGNGLWNLIAGTGVVTTPSSESSAVTGLSIGTNSFTWTITSGSCPPSVDTIHIVVYDLPSIAAAGADQILCVDQTNLAGNTPTVGTGLWTLILGSGTIVSPASASSNVTSLGLGVNLFQWTISNGTCPPSIDTVEIFVSPLPTIPNAGPDQSLCNVSSSVLAANTPLIGNGLWTLVAGSGTITIPTSETSTVTGLSIGVNSFEWSINIGTCTYYDTVNIVVYLPPSASNAGLDQTVCFDSTDFTGNTPVLGNGVWTLIAGTGIIQNPSSPTSTVTGLSVGVNSFTWTITNGSCPPSVDTVDIIGLPPTTVANAGADQFLCNLNNSVFAGNTPIVGTGLWTLIAGTGIIVTPASETSAVNGLSIGTNTFVWTITNGFCPPTIDTVSIVVYPLPTASNAGPDQNLCIDSTMINGNIPVTGVGTWIVVTGTGTVDLPNSATTDVTGMSVGANTFVWSIASGTCPPSTDTIIVIVNAPPTPAFAGTDLILCADSVILTANTPVVGTGFWSLISGTGTIISPTSPTTQINGLSLGTNTFMWTITSGTCPPSSDIIDLTVLPQPSVSNAGPDQTVYIPIAYLSGNTPSIGIGSWSLVSGSGTIVDPFDPNSQITNLLPGTNVFKWSISNSPCTNEDDFVIIEVKEYIIPNGFSPNGDAFNDIFLVPGVGYFDNVSISVFNRWGGLVFKSENYQNDWDGSNMNGDSLIDDTYYYLIDILGYDKFQGYVVIKRK